MALEFQWKSRRSIGIPGKNGNGEARVWGSNETLNAFFLFSPLTLVHPLASPALSEQKILVPPAPGPLKLYSVCRVDIGRERPSQILRSLCVTAPPPNNAPLSLQIINSATLDEERILPEQEVVRLVFEALDDGTTHIEYLDIHTRLKSSLPHPALLLYVEAGRHLRCLTLDYDVDDTTLGYFPIPSRPPSLIQSVYPRLSELIIGGTTLLELVKCDRALNLLVPLANLASLSIKSFSDCLHLLTADHLDTLFNILVSLTKLQSFRIEGFGIPNRLRNAHPLQSNHPFEVSLKRFIIVETDGYALSYLIRRIIPNELMLEDCRSIEHLPPCTKLSLRHISPNPDFSHVLSQWDGVHLEISSSLVVDDAFVCELEQLSRLQRQPLWPHLRYIDVHNCSAALSRWLEVLEVRSRRLGRPASRLSVDPYRHRNLYQWKIELSKAVKATTALNHNVEGVRLQFSNA
ncbi:hypothetical protein NMY22_g12030 [Coprinellus aureogranulatus]|nr:hypothetical protein NMY22_g12030 [Coprinellus aureogranulatus]